MTVITLTSPVGRLSADQMRELSVSLTDAVLVPEIGQAVPAARAGFQVHFVELPSTHMAIGGQLISESGADTLVIDIAVMDGDWRGEVRKQVVDNVFAALTKALGAAQAAPGWWVNFRVIDEGSWGSRGGVLSILSLLESGVFSEDKVRRIREKFGASE